MKRILFFIIFTFTCVGAFPQRGARAIRIAEKAAKELKIATKKAEEIGEKSKIEMRKVQGNNAYPYRNGPVTAPMPSRRYAPSQTSAGRTRRSSSNVNTPYNAVPYVATKAANSKIIKCPACNGTGKNYYGNPCRTCAGSGLVSASVASNYRASLNNTNNSVNSQPSSKRSSPLRNIGIIALILCGVGFCIYLFHR